MKTLNLNPEFQRNLWLEMSLHRLIGMPAILGGIFLLASLRVWMDSEHPVGAAAIGLYFLITLGWGTYLAGETVTSEVKHGTWDLQRLSAITPWSMTWGKLFGATVYPWYGGLICLVVAAFTAPQLRPLHIPIMIGMAVLAQAVSLLSSLMTIRKGKGLDRSAVVGHLVLGNLAAFPFFSLLDKDSSTFSWFGHAYGSDVFALGSVIAWAGWAVLGCYRTMASELQVARTPSLWIAFCLFVWVYIIGFLPEDLAAETIWHVRALTGFGLMSGLTYLTLFTDRKDPAALRRMQLAGRQGRWRRLWEQMPDWLPSLVMAILCAGWLSVLLLVVPMPPDVIEKGHTVFGLRGVTWMIAMALFVVRDVAIILFFNLGARKRRADLTAAVYLAVLYLLIPGIFSGMKLDAAAAAFWPWLPDHINASLLSGLVQAALAVTLTLRRWHKGTDRAAASA